MSIPLFCELFKKEQSIQKFFDGCAAAVEQYAVRSRFVSFNYRERCSIIASTSLRKTRQRPLIFVALILPSARI